MRIFMPRGGCPSSPAEPLMGPDVGCSGPARPSGVVVAALVPMAVQRSACACTAALAGPAALDASRTRGPA